MAFLLTKLLADQEQIEDFCGSDWADGSAEIPLNSASI